MLPLMVWAAGRYLFTLDPLWLTVATLNAAMPAGANVYLVAQLYRTRRRPGDQRRRDLHDGQRGHAVRRAAVAGRAGALKRPCYGLSLIVISAMPAARL